MNREETIEYFLSKRGAVEERPFNEFVPVFKVGGKMFALYNVHEKRSSINLKYYKDDIHEIRCAWDDITPGYHMNKNHWNTVYIDGELDDEFIKKLVDISYDLVFNSLTKKKQKEILENE